jgi:heme/copper-type cytochrome/quinol oxidase subunit 2
MNLNQEEVDSFLEKKRNHPFRQLEVDKSLVLPLNEGIRMFVSSADVIHCFALPSLGVKVDAVPGRLKELYMFPLNIGKYYGQCSEICGANHAFMPISVEILPVLD